MKQPAFLVSLGGLAFVVSVASIPSFATTSISVCDEPSPIQAEPEIITPTFSAEIRNPQLKRAWVEVEVEGNYSTDNIGRENGYLRKKIDGLSLDPNTKNVIFTKNEGPPVTCATFVKGGMFSGDKLKPTGACKFTTKTKSSHIDDGFRLRNRTFIVVDMNVETPPK
jgi:hypothetical protein